MTWRPGQERFEHPKGVLSEPQHPVAFTDAAVRAQRVGELIDAVVELRPRQPDIAVDHGGALRLAAAVLTQDVAECQRVQQVHGHPAIMPRTF